MKFSSFELDSKLVKSLSDCDYNEATQIQEQSIPIILAKHDVMARAQTGTGKTAAFALPIIQSLIEAPIENHQLKGLILAPTRELSIQLYKSFCTYSKYTDLKTTVVHGGVSSKNQIEVLHQGIDILIATPGRLLDLINQGVITLDSIQVVVFDEADRMLDLGFKEEIDNITQYLPDIKQTLLFSATFSDSVYNMSKPLLKNPKKIEIDEKNQSADNVEQIIYSIDKDRKRELTSFLIGSKNWQQVLIFTRTKQSADELTKEMLKDGIKALALHGDKSQGARDKALNSFKNGSVRALVATDVAARGIDIKELSYVINYELPHKAEDYIHRIGRTARAGNSGIAISLVSIDEEWLLTAIEEFLGTKLLQQWYPGYEPDLNKKLNDVSRKPNKKNARNKALGSKHKSTVKTRNRKR